MGSDRVRRRAVFLDRDGVLNRAVLKDGLPYPPSNANELSLLPGVTEACQRLKCAGFLLIGVTNQPDVARGRQSREAVEAINATLLARLALDQLRVCYHDDDDGCDCRKPQPGLLNQAAAEFEIDLAGSFMIGDRWKDIEAGRRAGCTTILISSHYLERKANDFDCEVSSLTDAAEWILKRNTGEDKTK